MFGSSHLVTCICSREHFDAVTPYFELDLDRVRMIKDVKYLGKRSFNSKVIVGHIRRLAAAGKAGDLK